LAELRDRVHSPVEVRLHPLTRTPRQIKGKVLEHAAFGYASEQDKNFATAKNFLQANKALLQLEDPAAELQLIHQDKDDLGRSHLRYNQMYQGLPVRPAELIVHVNPDGNIDLLDGAFVATPHTLDTVPTVEEKAALAQARKAVPGGEDATVRGSELIIYAPGDTPSQLAWEFELAVSLTADWMVIIDARSGATLTAYNQVTDSNVSGSGVDIFGATKPLNMWQENGTFFLTDTSKPMYDPSLDPPAPDTTRGGITMFDAQNNSEPPFFLITSTSPTSGWLSDGVSAAFNFSETYDYFLQQHNWNSYDDQGSSLNAIVRFSQNHANASWNPGLNIMLFGDADLYTGALDVVGHELTHGITNFTANLVYQNQPGALNEAFSDILASWLKLAAKGTQTGSLVTHSTKSFVSWTTHLLWSLPLAQDVLIPQR
jgi:Zn-dependent metalloprotease